jgi:gamma-glutamyltranspeptidase/glutathione hydrolase
MKRILTAALFAATAAHAAAPAHVAVVAGNPLAAQAGLQMLRAGGTAADAAIAAQAVLGLVEPENSGFGGYGLALYYDVKHRDIGYYDGSATAPAGVDAAVPTGGRAVGVPGTLAMLELLYKAHGHTPWADLFKPAIRLATEGFPLSPTLAAALRASPPPALARLLFPGRTVPKPGTLLKNPDYAETLRQIAANGSAGLMQGHIAGDIARAVRADAAPGLMTEDDLAAYQPVQRAPVCGAYRKTTLCSAGFPSIGGGLVLRTLALLAPFDLLPRSAGSALLLLDAQRLAAAGAAGAQDKPLSPDHALPALPPPAPAPPATPGATAFVAVDAKGDAVALSSALGSVFGSRIAVDGLVLNNALAAFAAHPQPGDRPATSMAPVMVLDPTNKLLAALATNATQTAPAAAAQALIATQNWRQAPTQALATPHIMLVDGRAVLEENTPEALQAPILKLRGETTTIGPLPSATAMVAVTGKGAVGGADPRGDGVVAGD